MTCQEYKDLMMAYMDNEIDDDQRRAFEEHVAHCPQCAKEMEEFTKLKRLTDNVTLVEPEDRMWEQYWQSVYNCIERGLGWVLFSVAAIALLVYGGFQVIEKLIRDETVGLLLKVGLLTLLVGLAILFVSILRERVYFWRRDRYKNVRR